MTFRTGVSPPSIEYMVATASKPSNCLMNGAVQFANLFRAMKLLKCITLRTESLLSTVLMRTQDKETLHMVI